MTDTPRSDHETCDEAQRRAGDPSKRLLGATEVMERYGLCDRRTARGVMDTAGAFVVARRLYVREADLLADEEALRGARRSSPHAEGPSRSRPAGRHPSPSPARADPLPPGWWREDSP